MPIFLSAYNTTFGHRYSTDATKGAIAKALVSNYLTKNNDEYTVIKDTSEMPVDIPAFTHPLYLEKAPYDGLYVDVRPFVSRNRQSGEMKISSVADYNLLLARAGLEHIWRNESPLVFRKMSPLPASVFSAWLAENIGKNIGLEPEDQYKLTVFSAWFYFSLFTNDETPTPSDYNSIVQAIHKATRINPEPIMQVLDGLPYVKSVTDYCAQLEDVVGSVRLRGFGTIRLWPILNSTWFSSNSSEMIAVSVEHVPTFLSMMLSAMTERSYQRTPLSKMIERVPAKDTSKDFILQMTATLNS